MKNADDILTFLAVARTGSISAAARQLRNDPATVGRKVQRLEEELRNVLFAKSPRGYHLSEAGQRLIVQAEELEAVLIGIDGSFSQRGSQLEGRLRIGAPDGCATFVLPEICAGLTQSHPDLLIEIVVSSREFDLLNHEVDLAISVKPPSAKAIASTHLADYKLHFAAASALVQAHGSNLADVPLISYIPELLVDPSLDIPSGYRVKEPSLRSNSVVVQWEWLRAGKGIGLVHDFAFRKEADLVHVHPEFALDRSYYLNTRQGDARFKRTQNLVRILHQEVQSALSAA